MYRFFEILPGALAWLTLILMVLLSWQLPTAVAIFIILFDIYWLLKTIYLSLHLRATFSAMKENLKVDWARRLEELPRVGPPTPDRSVGASELNWKDIYHLMILPMYREPYEVVRESFLGLLKTNYPKDKLLVVLATEERAGKEAKEVARKIEKEFGKNFFRFLVTVHPKDLPNEIPGKGSNETWAVREAQRLIIDPFVTAPNVIKKKERYFSETPQPGWLGAPPKAGSARRGQARPSLEWPKRVEENSGPFSYDNILVSVFDIDTQIFPEYFGRLTYVFLNSENRLRAIYQPIPLFTNNIYKASALSRVVSFSATFWQMMQQSRPERLTSFSSQSLPFRVVLDMGYWHTNVVSEDSRVFWQGYLTYHGDFRVEPLLYPVSMDANVAPTFWQTMKNIYRQQRRWGWGAENIPYMLCGKQSEKSEFHPNTPKIDTHIVEKELSYKLTGIFFRVQKTLGRFARERQYGDMLSLELANNGIRFKREQAVEVGGRKSNFIDFIIEDKIAVELKAKSFINKEDYYQVQRYLWSSKLELGLIINFAQPVLKPKRVLNTSLYSQKKNSEHSDVFADSDRREGFLYDQKIPSRKKWYWSLNVIEGFHAWATNSLMIFALGWLPVILGGKNFNFTLLSYGLPQITKLIISLSMVGIASSAVLGILLLPPRPEWFRVKHYLIYFFQWLLIPVTLIVFGAFPGLEAQTRLALGGRFKLGFWVTPKMREGVGEKR